MRRFAILLFLVSLPGLAAAWSSGEIAGCIRDPGCHRTFVVAHRGNGFGGPENSRAGVRNAVAAGVPVIEIDLHLSRDGQVFVIHDDTLDRTTDRKGEVAALSAEELARARLSNGEPLPSFEEIYAITRGRAVLDLHFQKDALEPVAEFLARSGSFDDAIFFLMRDDLARTAARLRRRHPAMMLLVKGQTVADAVRVSAFFESPPEAVHPDWISADLQRDLHARGQKMFLNCLDPDARLEDGRSKAAVLLDLAPDFIQSDSPAFFLRALGH